jgi:predicted nucleic acid-binding protein
MTLTDAGPLFVLFNRKDPSHERCKSVLPQMPGPLLTTWPCFTEAMYLLGRDLGYRAQDELLAYVADGLLRIHFQTEDDCDHMRALMSKYQDAPMDLADASLVVAAETLGLRRVFTLDRHFYAYRLSDGSALEVVP